MGARIPPPSMPRVKSCGFLLFRDGPPKSFLLMRLTGRYDLPKGHLEEPETELQCALRELREETGILPESVELDPDFRYTETYFPRYRRFGGRRVEKTLVIFLGRLIRPVTKLRLTEHESWEWCPWPPYRRLQHRTIDPLLAQVAAHWARREGSEEDEEEGEYVPPQWKLARGERLTNRPSMPLSLQALLDAFEQIAPPRLAEPWDNVGLLAGDPAAPLRRLLLTIDYTAAVAREARALGCQAVVSYHPPLFQPTKRVVAGDGIFEAIRDGIALYSPHTALDVAPGGTNDVLCDLLGAGERRPLRLSPGSPQEGEKLGIGRVADLPPTPRAELIERARRGLGLRSLLVGGPTEGEVSRVAVCAGAGSELLGAALAERAQLFLTGELRHHDVLRAARAGVTVLCALHSNSERVALAPLAERLASLLPGVEVLRSEADEDPLRVV